MDGQAISDRLKKAAEDRKTTSVAFFQVDFNHAITSSVIDTIRRTSRQPGRLWDELCFFHCRCDGVNGGSDDEANEQQQQQQNNATTTITSSTATKRNMDAIVQVAMAADIFHQLTVKGPAGHDNIQQGNNNINNNDGDDTNNRRRTQPARTEQEQVLGQHAFDSIGMGLSFNQRLSKLHFSHFSLTSMQAAALGRGLATSTCVVEQLIFSKMAFCDGAITELAKGLSQNKSLHTLAVTSCKLSDSKVACLVMGIKDHPTLKVLRLFGNKCRRLGASALADLLSSSSSRLEVLELHHQRDPRPPRLSLRLRLLQQFQLQQQERDRQQPNGQQQQQQQQQQRDEQANFVQPQQEINRSMESSSDGNNNDHMAEDRLPVELLARGLRHNRHLRRLNLSSNKLRDEDIASLGRVLWMSNVSILELENNEFTEKGLEIFASCRISSKLKTLRLQGSQRLKPEGRGAQLLIKILQVHERLETVDRDKFWTQSELRPKIQHWMDYNGGGRALLAATHSSSDGVPGGLWPKVLARVNHKFQTSEDRQANVLFNLLQGPVLLEQQHPAPDTHVGRKRKREETARHLRGGGETRPT